MWSAVCRADRQPALATARPEQFGTEGDKSRRANPADGKSVLDSELGEAKLLRFKVEYR